MKTAEEMANFCIENNTGSGMSKKWNIKHFTVVENQLSKGEVVLFAFVGLYNYISATKHDSNYAIAVTNKRIIAGQKKLFGENVNIILRKHLNDVSKTTGAFMGTITIDTIKETFNIGTNKPEVNAIHKGVTRVLFEEEKEIVNVKPGKSNIEVLKEYKELLELEIITKEEFNKKKLEVLG